MFAKAFAARGFAGVAPDYRLRSDRDTDTAGTVSDAVADGRKALAWVRAHAAEYGLDATRLILAGGSAGGMLVLNMCHDAGRPIDRQRDNVRAIFDMWGTPGGVLRLFAHPYAGSLPTLLIHGTADKLVPYQNSVRLARELSGLGVANRLLTLPDAPHTPLAHFEQIVAAMEAFLREHVAP
jgi:acetyl esterase/lipase